MYIPLLKSDQCAVSYYSRGHKMCQVCGINPRGQRGL